MRVQINNVTQGRTEVVNNSEWSVLTPPCCADAVCAQTSIRNGTRSSTCLVSAQCV